MNDRLLFMARASEILEITALPPVGKGKKKRFRAEIRNASSDSENSQVKVFLSKKSMNSWLSRQRNDYSSDGFVETSPSVLQKKKEESLIFNGVTLNTLNVVDLDSNRVVLQSKDQTSKPKEDLAVFASLTVPIGGIPKIVGVLLKEDRSYICAGNIVDGALSIRKQVEVTCFSVEWMTSLVKKVRAFLTKLQEIRIRYKVQRAAFVGRSIECDDAVLAQSVKQEFVESDFRVNEDALISAVKFGRVLIS